jgi:hypothetical protein
VLALIRFFTIVGLLLATALTPAWTQASLGGPVGGDHEHEQNWALCQSNKPDIVIPNCTAVIDDVQPETSLTF